MPPSCQSINLWNTKKGKNQWEVCPKGVSVHQVNWSWSPNGVTIGWPYHGLWLGYWVLPFVGLIHLRQIGAICPSVQPTALEKPNSTYSPNASVESNNKNIQEAGLGGGSLFKVRQYQIDVKNHIKTHISTTNILFRHNWLYRFQRKEIIQIPVGQIWKRIWNHYYTNL